MNLRPARGTLFPTEWTRPILTGALAVVVALLVGLAIAVVLVGLGLTTTGVWPLNTWLAGGGLLGGWSQSVTATVAGGLEWSTWVAGAPMFVTVAVIGTVAAFARRTRCTPTVGTLLAAGGAAIAALLLVIASGVTTTTDNAAGSATVRESLTVVWTGGTRPGTVLGAALLVGGTWWVNTGGLAWWRGGAALVKGLLIVPGLVLTLVAAAGVVYLTSSPALGVTTIALFPLVGVQVLLGLGGAPSSAGITRLSPEPYDLWTWSTPLYGVAGLIVLVVLAVVVGLVLRARGHAGSCLDGVSVTAVTAAFLAWATDSVIDVPAALGGQTRLMVNPLAAAVVGAALAAVALLVRGRTRVAAAASDSGA